MGDGLLLLLTRQADILGKKSTMNPSETYELKLAKPMETFNLITVINEREVEIC